MRGVWTLLCVVAFSACGLASDPAPLRVAPAPPPPPPAPPPAPARESAPAAYMPSRGLVAHWAGNGSAADGVGVHHGKAVNVRYTADRHGNARGAFDLDGSGARVIVADCPALDTDDAFTLCAWINPRRYPNRNGLDGGIVTKWTHTQLGNGDYLLWIDRSGHLAFWVGFRETVHVEECLTSRAKIATKHWTHVAATFDRGEMRTYLNGVLAASITSAKVKYTSRKEYASDDIHIGAKYNGKFAFDGAIDDVCLYRRALSAAEVRGVMNSSDALGPAPFVRRVAETDRVEVDGGDVLLGAIENEAYTVTASFGRVQVPAARVVGFLPGGKATAGRSNGGGRTVLLLTDGQVLIGKLHEAAVRIRLTGGSVMRVPVGSVRQCGYRISKARPAAGVAAGTMLVLDSGERLALAGPAETTLPLTTPHGRIRLPLCSLLRLDEIDPQGRTHRARLLNGSTLSGALPAEKLTFRLRLGPELKVGRQALRRLVCPARPVEPIGGTTVTMRNGDRLLGRVADNALTVRTDFGDAKILPASVLKMTFDANRPGALNARMWDGTALSGQLAQPAVTFATAPGGPTLKLAPARIATIVRPAALPPPAETKKIEAIIARLGSESYKDRQAASEALTKLGSKIAPLLRRHLNHADPEVRQRIEAILDKFSPKPPPPPPPRPAGPVTWTTFR